jgi:hypothetical protein
MAMSILSSGGLTAKAQVVAFMTTVVLLTALGGCGGSDSNSAPAGNHSSEVASIKTPATASARATAVKAERPLMRDDDSEADRARLIKVYTDCMVEHGLPKGFVAADAYPDDLDDLGLRKGLAAKINAACATKEPESPFRRAARLDPEFADHVRANVKCLNSHGVKAVVNDDGGVGLVDGLPSSSKARWLEECEKQAFATYYSTLD